ncbi:MAG: autotransporter-associated beta strand repeat-containing protein [Verrucomicrobiota bacterium]
MKPSHLQRALPQTFIVCFAPLIAVAAHAAIVNTNESNTTNIWTFPAGTNLLAGVTPSPTAPLQPDHGNTDQTGALWTILANNTLGTAVNKLESVAPNNFETVVFPLNTTVNTGGYNISQFDAYGAWPDSGRDNLDFTIQVSTIENPTFTNLVVVSNHTVAPILSTHTRITNDSGFLATGVTAFRFVFGTPTGQENGFVGYREFIALGTPAAISPAITWTGGSGSAGNANWVSTADNNWKDTSSGAPVNFSSGAPVNFDSTGTNRNITVPSALTAFSLEIANDNSSPYVLGGQALTVSNEVVSSGSGSVTFNNALIANTAVTSGLTLSGTGSLVFNSTLQSGGLVLSGAGDVSLNAANPGLTGNIAINDGTLNVNHNSGLANSTLLINGGTARFTTAAPFVASLGGTVGSIILGNSVGPVNSVLTVGNSSLTPTSFSGDISPAAGATAALAKTNASSLTLSGENTYTGPTRVLGGSLIFGQRLSLYDGTTASWTAANLIASSGAALGFRAGGAGEFTDAEIDTMPLGGFASGSFFGVDTTVDLTLSRSMPANIGLQKSGAAALILTGSVASTGTVKIVGGPLNAANPSGNSIGGNVLMGDGSAEVYLNMVESGQFGPGSVITMANLGTRTSRMNLRGTNQTVAGLNSTPSNYISIVQNDETEIFGPATLTINATTNHSFYGILRNQAGGSVSIIKNGAGTQEFLNNAVQGNSYNGPTSVNEGKLRLNFNGANSNFGSDITVNSPGGIPAILEFDGTFNFDRMIAGPGQVVKQGTGSVTLTNDQNQGTGGISVSQGTLRLYSIGAAGDGTTTGQFCPGGAMSPSQVITVSNGATLALDFLAPLGNSGVLPQYAPSIKINQGGKLSGGTNTVAFVSNLTLDGATVDVTSGAGHGGFNTNLAFVGTVVVGGTSILPSMISTTGTGPYANISLGSLGLLGTTFQVANVTNSSAVDLTVNSVLQNVGGQISSLTKTGAGTMFVKGAKTYTGATNVSAGELRLDTVYLADTAEVSIASSAFLNMTHSSVESIGRLILGGVQMPVGKYAAVGNGGAGITETARIKGFGTLQVTIPPITDPFELWALQISNPADRGRTSDPDGDASTNLQEFLFGTSPNIANGSLSTFQSTPSGLIVRWSQRATGTSTYVLRESTTSLESTWQDSTAPVSDGAIQDLLPDYRRKEALIPIDSVRKFVRVQATE